MILYYFPSSVNGYFNQLTNRTYIRIIKAYKRTFVRHFRKKVARMKNNLVFENHDAYLLYSAALEKNPELPAHGSISVQYALYLYYKAYPEERLIGYRYKRHMLA